MLMRALLFVGLFGTASLIIDASDAPAWLIIPAGFLTAYGSFAIDRWARERRST
jgi:hypothetical protein